MKAGSEALVPWTEKEEERKVLAKAMTMRLEAPRGRRKSATSAGFLQETQNFGVSKRINHLRQIAFLLKFAVLTAQ